MAKVVDLNKTKVERAYEQQLKDMFVKCTYTQDWSTKINNKGENK